MIYNIDRETFAQTALLQKSILHLRNKGPVLSGSYEELQRTAF